MILEFMLRCVHTVLSTAGGLYLNALKEIWCLCSRLTESLRMISLLSERSDSLSSPCFAQTPRPFQG